MLSEGFDVDTARDASEGVACATARMPDVIIMDIGLPGQDGVSAVRSLRDAGLWIPILMLTAHGQMERRLESFRAGADDFLPKPFHNDELVLHLHALTRRSRGVPHRNEDRLRSGDTILDLSTRLCWRGTREITLSRREFELLELLVRNTGRVLSRDRIADEIWGGEIVEGANAVDVYVGYLRRKLEQDGEPRVIENRRGHGFVFRSRGFA